MGHTVAAVVFLVLSNVGLSYSWSDLVKMSEISKTNYFFSFWEEIIDMMNEIKHNLLQEIMTKNGGGGKSSSWLHLKIESYLYL